MKELTVGNAVRLNSDGPIMLISAFFPEGLLCLFLDANGITHTDIFKPATVTKITEESIKPY